MCVLLFKGRSPPKALSPRQDLQLHAVLHEPCRYTVQPRVCEVPIQVASMHAELSQKVVLVPTAPTSLNASLALGAIGIMVRQLTHIPANIATFVRN